SLAVRTLRDLAMPRVPTCGEVDRDPLSPGLDRALLEELLLVEEIWARSYAQYIAVRSADGVLLRGLGPYRRRVPDRVYYPYQWDDNDFEDIAQAIETLFRRFGWRVRRGP